MQFYTAFITTSFRIAYVSSYYLPTNLKRVSTYAILNSLIVQSITDELLDYLHYNVPTIIQF